MLIVMAEALRAYKVDIDSLKRVKPRGDNTVQLWDDASRGEVLFDVAPAQMSALITHNGWPLADPRARHGGLATMLLLSRLPT